MATIPGKDKEPGRVEQSVTQSDTTTTTTYVAGGLEEVSDNGTSTTHVLYGIQLSCWDSTVRSHTSQTRAGFGRDLPLGRCKAGPERRICLRDHERVPSGWAQAQSPYDTRGRTRGQHSPNDEQRNRGFDLGQLFAIQLAPIHFEIALRSIKSFGGIPCRFGMTTRQCEV